MSQSGSGYWIQFLEGVEPLIQRESGSANFGTKLAPSLNGADLSFMNSVTGSICRAKCSNILQDIIKKMKCSEYDPRCKAYLNFWGIQWDIYSFGNPAMIRNTNSSFNPPFSHFDHLVIRFKITILANTPFYILGSTYWIQWFIDVYIKEPFGANLYLYVLQISRV